MNLIKTPHPPNRYAIGHPLPQGEREFLPYALCLFYDIERKKLWIKNTSPLVGEVIQSHSDWMGEGYSNLELF